MIQIWLKNGEKIICKRIEFLSPLKLQILRVFSEDHVEIRVLMEEIRKIEGVKA